VRREENTMGRLTAFAFAAVCAAIAATAPASAAPPFSDTNCPRAVQNVVAFNDAAAANDAPKIRAAAHGAADAYRACASVAQATTNIAVEPIVNYDKTRAAQFLIVAGRLDAASGDAKAATAALTEARAMAKDVVEWQPQSLSYTMSNGGAGNSSSRNSDRNGSRYKTAALEIVASADVELAKLGQASPQPAASTKP
jgi:hypothetical protein